MKSEKEKMLSGDLYNANDAELVAERLRARELCRRLSLLPAAEADPAHRALLAELFGTDSDVYLTPPFFCDYGWNIRLGRGVYFNFNCVILDGAPVAIGDRALFGPAVQVYTAAHPLDIGQRRAGLEFCKPVSIGSDAWIGGGAVICPGVRIGDGAVIGAGSVVTRDVPGGMLAVGNPCRVVREI